MRRLAWVLLVLLGGLLAAPQMVAARSPAVPHTAPPESSVPAQESTTTTAPGQLPPAAGPLVPVSPECVVPAPATAVFLGFTELVDDPARPSTYRFRVQSLLAGTLAGYEVDGQVDVRFGDEAKFLEVGASYLVGVAPDPQTGLLISKVREPAPLFGGDAVIGADDSDIDCPRVQDPVRTLQPDGGSVDTGVLTPLKEQRSELLLAVLRPLGVALAVLLSLVLLKQLFFAVGRSVRDIGGDPVPVPARQRRHRTPGSTSGAVE